jgi:hypothetical protein
MKLVPLVFVLALVPACAESVSTRRDAASPNDAAAIDAATLPDTGTPNDAFTPTVDSGTPTPGLVVNEIEATGTEFVELLNTGTAPVDLSALRFTDDDMGMPNASHVTALPAGVVLHTGERLVIVTNVSGAAPGLSMGADCMLTGVDRCMQASFGISNTNGDAAYVLASDDSIVAEAHYPAMGAPDERSYGRLPDGSGAFATCTPTPDAANTP